MKEGVEGEGSEVVVYLFRGVSTMFKKTTDNSLSQYKFSVVNDLLLMQ